MILKILIVSFSVIISAYFTYILWGSDEFKNGNQTWYKFYKIASKIGIAFIWIAVLINAIILIRN